MKLSSRKQETVRMRGFNPAAVQPGHIRKIVFLYGEDYPGMMLRLARFEEVLSESGADVRCYSSMDDEAMGFIRSGDMFSDDIFVSVKDITPVLGSDAISKKKMKMLCAAIESYPDTSRFLFAAPSKKNTLALDSFLSFVAQQKGIARRVEAPGYRQMAQWVTEYLKSTGRQFPEHSIELVARVAKDDVEVARTILDNIGEEISSMSEREIVGWLELDQQVPLQSIYEALCRGDIGALDNYRMTFSAQQSGLRLFLLKLRYMSYDLMFLTSCPEGRLSDFEDYKRSQYGRFSLNSWNMRKMAMDNGGYRRFADMYFHISDALQRISGASRKPFSYHEFMAGIAVRPA